MAYGTIGATIPLVRTVAKFGLASGALGARVALGLASGLVPSVLAILTEALYAAVAALCWALHAASCCW